MSANRMAARLVLVVIALCLFFNLQSHAQRRIKLLAPAPGRLHLINGSNRTALLVYIDYNKIKAIENDVESIYSPLEVSSFVIAQDSFAVLKDFNIAIGDDEQYYRIAFVQVSVAGPGFALYHFQGTMRREIQGHLVMGAGGMAMGQTQDETKYLMSKVWFMKLDGQEKPNWVSLPNSGSRIKAIVRPIIADDKNLDRATHWNSLAADDVKDVLAKYLANKRNSIN